MKDKNIQGIRKVDSKIYENYKSRHSNFNNNNNKNSKKNNQSILKKFKNWIKKVTNSEEERKLVILVFLLIFTIITISLIIYTYLFKPIANNNNSNSNINQVYQNQNLVNRVRDKEEHERFKIYLGDIIKNLKNKEYETVYNKLNDNYKEKYFKTQDEFISYVENKLPQNMIVNHTNIERIDNYYIITVDLVNSRDYNDIKNRKNMYFVFREYGFDDYSFSFSKIPKLNIQDQMEFDSI